MYQTIYPDREKLTNNCLCFSYDGMNENRLLSFQAYINKFPKEMSILNGLIKSYELKFPSI